MLGRYAFIVSAFLSVSTVGLLVLVLNRHFDNPNASTKQQKRALYMFSDVHNRKNSEICTAHECIQVAEYIKKSIDSTVNPCSDFFQFSCGGWIKRNPIPKSYNDFSTFTKLSKDIEKEIYELLQMSHDGAPQNEALVKTRDFYSSCMDTVAIERLGAKPMLDFIREIGSWSICNDGSWNKSAWDIHEVLKYLQSTYYPASPFFSVEVTNDHLNSTKHLIKVDQSGLSLQREIYFKHPEMVDIYVDYMSTVAKLLGTKCNTTAKMREIIDFEKKLAKFTTSAEDKAEGIYRRMNLKTLIKLVPQFPWLDHMRAIFKEAHVTKTEVVLATSPSYLQKMTKLLKSTSKELLSNYVVWQMIRDKISLLSSPFRKARAKFNERISGVEDTDPRWRTCTGITNDNMGVPIGSLYVSKFFAQSAIEKTQTMINEIMKTFKNRVKKHEWIDEKTTKSVFEKADALGSKIGYAKYVVQPEELVSRFKNLRIASRKFFKNNLEVDKWVRRRLFNKLRKPVDKEKWPMFPQTINAMYQFYENEIVIPAGILQSPFFYSANIPRSLSYGALGSIIGHEITHGFDNTGRKFDKNGDIVKEWWSNSSVKEFNKKAKCIEKQYSKYKVQGKYPISGKVTLGENIADNGGTKLSYFAYHDWLHQTGNKEFLLPGLEYSNEQLFFIGYAQEYCSHARQKTEYIATLSEIHAPPKFRVIGTLSNFKEFSVAFNCPVNSTMNPRTKCEVW
ncbi:endothelin-converting enzyme 2-like [Porites lutea]|uniref:endothelin-converting enzyme 2-like n=1 Tax=Porites lutea TaxID=51062 RepID=UPI003CC5D42E